MLYMGCRVFWTGLGVGAVLVISACTSVNPPGDIPPMTPVETQSAPASNELVPTGTGLPTEISAPQVEATATSLPGEIAEPVSPVAPVPRGVESTVAPADNQAIPGSEPLLAAAKADLAQRINVPVDQITLVSVEATNWGDTSLGCPQEGMMYAQVITPGYLIILAAQGQQYEYHTNQLDNVVLCQQ